MGNGVLPPTIYHELRQRLTARDTLLEARKQLRNQQHAINQRPVQVESVGAHFEQVLTKLDAQIAALETEIGQVAQDGAWVGLLALRETIPGTVCSVLLGSWS